MNPPAARLGLLLLVLTVLGCEDSAPAPQGAQRLDPAEGAAMGPADAGPVQAKPPAAMLEDATIDAQGLTALRAQAKAAGQVLVIDCWATWCDSCVVMFPLLHQAMKERGDKVRLVSLCFDEGQAYLEKAGVFLTEQKAWEDAYLVKAGGDAKDALAAATGSDAFVPSVLPAVLVYSPDGALVFELLQTSGEPADWVQRVGAAVDGAIGR